MRAAYILILVMAALLPGLSTAGEGDDKAAAIAHYERGTRLYQVHEFADALAEFKAAYVAKPDPAFLFNIAQCHRNLGHTEEAVTFYRSFLKHAPVNDPNRAQVEARLRSTQNEEVFKADLEPDSGPVSATSLDDPFAADDRAVQPVTPSSPPPVTPSPPRPVVPAKTTSGTDQARVRMNNRRPVDHPDRGRLLRIAGIGCGAVGLASIGTAIYFYTRAQHYSDVVSNDPNHTAMDVKSGQNAEQAQWVFYGIGGVSLAAGAVLSWFGWTAVRPMVGPSLAGLSAGGTY